VAFGDPSVAAEADGSRFALQILSISSAFVAGEAASLVRARGLERCGIRPGMCVAATKGSDRTYSAERAVPVAVSITSATERRRTFVGRRVTSARIDLLETARLLLETPLKRALTVRLR